MSSETTAQAPVNAAAARTARESTLAGEAPKGRSQLRRVLREVTTNHLALVGALFLLAAFAIAVLAPAIAPYDPREQSLLRRLASPSSDYRLGTDELGRDEFSRLVW